MNPKTRRHARRLQVPFRGWDPTRHNADFAVHKRVQRAEKKVLAAFGTFSRAVFTMAAVATNAFNAGIQAAMEKERAEAKARVIETTTPESPADRMRISQAMHPIGRKSDYVLVAGGPR